MVNEKFRKALNAYVEEHEIQETYGDTIILNSHAYDNSIVGITPDGILVYDFNKMVDEYVEDEGCDEFDAVEWVEYNTLRALPYMGERKPIIIMDTAQTITEIFGDEEDEDKEGGEK